MTENIGTKKWIITAVVILKDEARYLEDWILYHLSLGFEHFLIYDNDSSDQIDDVLKKYIAGGVVTCISWPVRAAQIDAYNHALQFLRGCSEWVGFFDIDEYVVIHEHDNIADYLENCGADQILLPWRNFPYGGHKALPGGTDLESYFWAYQTEPTTRVQVKHLVRCAVALRATAHFSLISSEKTIIADGTPSTPAFSITNPSYVGAQINHYATRSYTENVLRLEKGQVDGGAEKKVATFAPLTPEGAKKLDYDASILRHFYQFSLERERWSYISDRPHRFGLMQRERVLSSWQNLPFYFCKSFANYLTGQSEISHGTDLILKLVDRSGKEVELRAFWHDEDLGSLHFRIDQRSFIPYFMGSVHYGDFVRRFGFEAQFTIRNLGVSDDWSWTYERCLMGKSFAAIFDLESDAGADIIASSGEEMLSKIELPPGSYAALVYYPFYLYNDVTLSMKVDGRCSIREFIFGTLP